MSATVAGRPVLASPRLARLAADVDAGVRDAVASFWSEMSERGTPLVEPIPDDPEARSLLTYVWRGDAATRNARLATLSWPSGGREAKMLTRIERTDVWRSTSYGVRPGHRTTYSFIVDESEPPAPRNRSAVPDPLNRDPLEFFAVPHHPEFATLFGSTWTLSTAVERAGTHEDCRYEPRGAVDPRLFRSERLGNERRIVAYMPPGVRPDLETRLVLILDGGLGFDADHRYVEVLDRLTLTRRIPPVVAVFVDQLQHFEVRPREMRFNSGFADFLALDLVPWITSRYGVARDAGHRVICGTSLGGIAAAFAALRHPGVFANVIAQSGSFPASAPGEREPESIARAIASGARVPVRFALDAGRLEGALAGDVVEGDHATDIVTATRHLRDVLRAKGYDVFHHEFEGAHDFGAWALSYETDLLALIATPATA